MARQDVVKNVAETVINSRRWSRMRTAAVEEAVDYELRDRGIRSRAAFERACAIVFAALGAEKRELCGRCMAELTETDREAGRCTQCGLLILKPAQTRWVGSSEADAVVRGRS